MSIERRTETVPVPRDLDCAAHIQVAKDLTASLYVLLRDGAECIEVRWIDILAASNNPLSRGYQLLATRGITPPAMSVEDELRACGM